MGAIEHMVLTRAVQSLPVGRYASIYAFNSGEFTSSPVSMGIYETKSLGIFTPTSTPMYLLGDDYDFYSISSNDTVNNNPASFESQIFLKNGIDYIWTCALKQEVCGHIFNVPLTYQHCCSQIILNIVEGENIYLGDIKSIKMTYSVPTNYLNIQTGIIKPSTSISTDFMNVPFAGYTGQIVMVPLQSSDSLLVSIDAEVHSVGNYKTYTAKIPLNNNELKSGYSYIYKLIIDSDNVTFSNINLTEWIPVNNSGTPIYPVD